MRGLSVKSFYVTLFVFLLIADSFAQKESYIPLNIRPAYEKGTRSLDGNPGPNYWQNSAKYKIKVNLDPRVKILNGSEEIIYNNNSPDSLSQIVVRLYQNISKATALRDFYLNEKALTDGMKLLKVKIFEDDLDLNNKKIIQCYLEQI